MSCAAVVADQAVGRSRVLPLVVVAPRTTEAVMTAPRIAARRLVNAEHESTHTTVITQYGAQRALMLAAIVALAACGDSSGPDKYPDMLGSYDVTTPRPTGSGTINITGQQDSILTGDARIAVPDIDSALTTGFGVAAVHKDGSIRFNIAPTSPDAWTFSGHVNGSTMSGSETMGRGGVAGSWTATRR